MDLRRPRRTRTTLVALVLVSLTLVTLDLQQGPGPVGVVRDTATDALAPVRDAAAWTLTPVRNVVGGVTGYGALVDENTRLRERVAELEGDAARGEAAVAERAELHELLELDDVNRAPTVAARVVAAPVSNHQQTVELDRGAADGVAVDAPVVNGAGLVGRVVDVSRTRATVRLVTDTASAVAVRLPSGATGVAQGSGPGRALSVELVDADADLEEGQVVVTSGLEGSGLPSYFPSGLVVGEVASVAPAPGGQDLEVALAPAVDLDRLALVRVVRTEVPR